MPCMCGDYLCGSCGPAQGNSRCPLCNEWVSEGCEHINRNGRLKRKYKKEAEEKQRLEAETDTKYWEMVEAEAAEFWKK